jgi:hypothetical protein
VGRLTLDWPWIPSVFRDVVVWAYNASIGLKKDSPYWQGDKIIELPTIFPENLAN